MGYSVASAYVKSCGDNSDEHIGVTSGSQREIVITLSRLWTTCYAGVCNPANDGRCRSCLSILPNCHCLFGFMGTIVMMIKRRITRFFRRAGKAPISNVTSQKSQSLLSRFVRRLFTPHEAIRRAIENKKLLGYHHMPCWPPAR